jgi:hypothetical protein
VVGSASLGGAGYIPGISIRSWFQIGGIDMRSAGHESEHQLIKIFQVLKIARLVGAELGAGTIVRNLEDNRPIAASAEGGNREVVCHERTSYRYILYS